MPDYYDIKRKKIETFVGYFFTFALIILIVFISLILFRSKWNFLRNSYITYYNYGNDIKPGTIVTINGLVVGEVKDVDIDELNRIEVFITIRKKYQNKIKDDSVAKIVRPLLIGNKQIDISPGSQKARILKAGEEILSEESSELVDLISGHSLQSFINDTLRPNIFGEPTGDQTLPPITVRDIYDNAIASLMAMNEFQKSLTSMSDSMNNFAGMINNMSDSLSTMGTAMEKMELLAEPISEMSVGLGGMSTGLDGMGQGLQDMNHGMVTMSKSFESMDENMEGLVPLTKKVVTIIEEVEILLKAMQNSILFKREVEKIRKEMDKEKKQSK